MPMFYTAGGGQVLSKSGVAASCPADTTEDILATVAIPAGAMGTSGAVRVTTVWTLTNSANTKTLRVRLGGISGTAFLAQSWGSGAVSVYGQTIIMNRGTANSQIGPMAGTNQWTTGGNAVVTGAIDTSVAQTLVITGQKALAGETLTLEGYVVELLP